MGSGASFLPGGPPFGPQPGNLQPGNLPGFLKGPIGSLTRGIPTPAPAAPPPVAVPGGGPIAPYTPQDIPQIIQDLPRLLSSLPLDEQSKLLSFLLTSDILTEMFNNLDNPKTRDSFDSVVKSLFDNGLLGQIAPDKAVMSEETQGALKDALQQKLTQALVDLGQNPKASDTQQTLNVPISKPGVPNQMPQSIASLVANTITNALLQTVHPEMQPEMQAANILAKANPELTSLLTSLIQLKILGTGSGVMQLMVPPKADMAGFQTQVSQLTEQLTQLNQQLHELGDMASKENWNIGPLKNFVSVPTTLLTMLKTIQPDDQVNFTLMKTFVANGDAIPQAILTRANEIYSEKFEFLKTIMLATATATMTFPKEVQTRQQVFQEVLLQAPALLNVFKLKDIVGGFKDDLERKQAAMLYRFKRMLFNAAHEVVIVANGKPTFEYNNVGIFHEELPILADKISITLPATAEELSFDQMEIIASDILLTFCYIKENARERLNEILKRHPRCMLYFLATDASITRDMSFPRTANIATNDPVAMIAHIERTRKAVKSFLKNSEFLKYQPHVLEAFLDEAKYEPTGEITRESLNIVHRAIADCSDFIDLDSPD